MRHMNWGGGDPPVPSDLEAFTQDCNTKNATVITICVVPITELLRWIMFFLLHLENCYSPKASSLFMYHLIPTEWSSGLRVHTQFLQMGSPESIAVNILSDPYPSFPDQIPERRGVKRKVLEQHRRGICSFIRSPKIKSKNAVGNEHICKSKAPTY